MLMPIFNRQSSYDVIVQNTPYKLPNLNTAPSPRPIKSQFSPRGAVSPSGVHVQITPPIKPKIFLIFRLSVAPAPPGYAYVG